MKTTYYGFNGSTIVKLGEFDNLGEALSHSETLEEFFYISSLDSWAQVAIEIIQVLKGENK